MVHEALRERFLENLEAGGGSAGNTRLREPLGWQNDTYWSVPAALIDEGIIQPGHGRGGSVNLHRAHTKPLQAAPQELSAHNDYVVERRSGDTLRRLYGGIVSPLLIWIKDKLGRQ